MHGSPLEGSSSVCACVCVWERNVLASSDFRLRCDSKRSFRRAIMGEFLDAAMFLSTRCFSRTFSRFGSEAGQFFSRLLVGHCHTEGARGGWRGTDQRDGERDTRDDRRRRLALAFTFARSYYRLADAHHIAREKKHADVIYKEASLWHSSGQAAMRDLKNGSQSRLNVEMVKLLRKRYFEINKKWQKWKESVDTS